MHPIENQVCTLEQAKEFDKLGVKAASYFVWANSSQTASLALYIKQGWHPMPLRFYHHELTNGRPACLSKEHYRAYSCAELGVLLPDPVEKNSQTYFYLSRKINRAYGAKNRFEMGYSEGDWHWLSVRRSKHEAHARADLLINLIEKNLINPKDLKL